MTEHHHPDLGRVDVYAVGVLLSLRSAVRSLVVPGIPRERRVPNARRYARQALRTIRRHVAARDWHALCQSFNGYLAEPYHFPAHMTRCGHGWTPRRALRDLDRHHEATR